MNTLEELQKELTRLLEEIKDSIRHDAPDGSEEPYILVDDELPPYAYWVLEKPLMQMYEVRRQMFSLMYPQKDVDKDGEA